MLALKTSAADMGERLLLSEVNHYRTRWVRALLVTAQYRGGGRCVVSMRSENKKGWKG
jgi:hypothetical protein